MYYNRTYVILGVCVPALFNLAGIGCIYTFGSELASSKMVDEVDVTLVCLCDELTIMSAIK